MKVALFGAGGTLGRAVALEALRRGHAVTGVTRSGTVEGISDFRFRSVAGTAADVKEVVKLVGGHDAVASAVGPRPGEDAHVIVATAAALLDGVEKAGLRRLVVIGGAGSLEVSPGQRLMDRPDYPPAAQPVARAHAEALELFRPVTVVDWTFVSPSEQIVPGERTGRFRTGKEQLLVGPDGTSRISIPDFAVAFVDELGRGGHLRQRITVGY